MTDHQVTIDVVGDHHYAISLRQGEDEEVVELRLHADAATVALITPDNCAERRLVEETVRYLLNRQRADDLPSALDLADVAAGYENWIEDMRKALRHGAGADRPDDEAGS